MKIYFFTILMGLSFLLQDQKTQGLAFTPPMGWSSWNKFGCDINEQIVREIADSMLTSGMKDVGYE
jgi:alpha-galactosidase